MLDFQQKRKLRKTFFSKMTVIILVAVAVLLSHATWSAYQRYTDAKENENRAVGHLAELQEREITLRAEIDRMSTERGVEEELRRRYSAVKEGEGVIVVVNPEGGNYEGGGVGGEEESFWKRVVEWLGL